jgi:hypothetical protein
MAMWAERRGKDASVEAFAVFASSNTDNTKMSASDTWKEKKLFFFLYYF